MKIRNAPIKWEMDMKGHGVGNEKRFFYFPRFTVSTRTDKGTHFCAIRTCHPLQAVTKLLGSVFIFNPGPFRFHFYFAANCHFHFTPISITISLRRPKTARQFR